MKILRLRKAKGLTQTDLADLCDTTQQQIAKIENGVVDPKLSTLRKIAAALDCEIVELFWTAEQFTADVNQAVDRFELDLKRNGLMDLNTICAKMCSIPAFHPYWESLKVNKSKNRVEWQARRLTK